MSRTVLEKGEGFYNNEASSKFPIKFSSTFLVYSVDKNKMFPRRVGKPHNLVSVAFV